MAVVKYKIPESEYTLDFIRALAMAAHLKLIQPSELTFMFENGTKDNLITKELLNRIVNNRKNRV